MDPMGNIPIESQIEHGQAIQNCGNVSPSCKKSQAIYRRDQRPRYFSGTFQIKVTKGD